MLSAFFVGAMTLFLGAVGIERMRHAVPAGLLADAARITAAILISNVFWGQVSR